MRRRFFCWVALIACFDAPAFCADEAPYGLERRVVLTTSRVIGSPDVPPPFRAVRVFTNLKFDRPIWVRAEPGTQNLWVCEHHSGYGGPAVIFRIKDVPDPKPEKIFTIDRIVYGVAFDPDYAKNGLVYLGMNGPDKEAVNKFDRVSRFCASRTAPFAIDPKSEEIILEWASNGHNGADLCFGNDGMLYVSSGDGTSDSDRNNTGQKLDTLLAKVLRVDPRHRSDGRPYSIPQGNPFVGRAGTRPETWAYGMRNPWRMSFDTETNQLWVGNNGQDWYEQTYLVKKGGNYGWARFEGSHDFHPQRETGSDPHTPPTTEHHHVEARSLTGGVVYHGTKLPELQGAYIYGDFSTGKIWAVKVVDERVEWLREAANTRIQITGFGLDTRGELLIVDHAGGLYTLEKQPDAGVTVNFPRRLSETGLFASVAGHKPMPGMIPYSVNSPLWSDGAMKERFIALPGKQQIEFDSFRGWTFEDGAVLVKTFSLGARRIETRLLTRQNGEWSGYSYLWNDAQDDAELVDSKGADRMYGDVKWHYPGRAECMVCHTRAAKWVLGLTELQMNRAHDYGGVKDNQIRTLAHIGALKFNVSEHVNELKRQVRTRPMMPRAEFEKRIVALDTVLPGAARVADLSKANVNDFVPREWVNPRRRWTKVLNAIQKKLLSGEARYSSLLPKEIPEFKMLPDPADETQPVALRARAYLHANCAHCHVEAGGGNALMELEFGTDPASEKAHLLNARPLHDSFKLPDAKLIVPGRPESSVLLHRMAMRGTGQMPQLATNVVDDFARKVIEAWIRSLSEPRP